MQQRRGEEFVLTGFTVMVSPAVDIIHAGTAQVEKERVIEDFSFARSQTRSGGEALQPCRISLYAAM
jgi:hypothetical protein